MPRDWEFPEGPIALAEGSVLVCELLGHRLSRIYPDGAIEPVAEIPGGLNGAAIGPDGAVYVCNNGGWLRFVEVNGVRTMGPPDWSAYIGGRIQRVDPDRGTVTDLYTECDGRPLRAPNDLVIDGPGGFWFTDTGIRDPSTRRADITGIYYAHTDGSPDDGSFSQIPMGDLMPTNICFGDRDGSGEYRDAFVTLGATGRLVHLRWPHRGLRLMYEG